MAARPNVYVKHQEGPITVEIRVFAPAGTCLYCVEDIYRDAIEEAGTKVNDNKKWLPEGTCHGL